MQNFSRREMVNKDIENIERIRKDASLIIKQQRNVVEEEEEELC